MKQSLFDITENERIADGVMLMRLCGDTSEIKRPGQFVNIALDGLYLRRPISVCDREKDTLTLIYKTVGKGTEKLSLMREGKLDVLTGLGNGYDTAKSGDRPLLIGGGVGVPPLYLLARELIKEGKTVDAVLGFNTSGDVFGVEMFKSLGVNVTVTTADGSFGCRGFVTDHLPKENTYVYTCGPEPMLKAVYNATAVSGQYSFEERMGCGFGACMGCSCKTKYGNMRICKDGPVLEKEAIIW